MCCRIVWINFRNIYWEIIYLGIVVSRKDRFFEGFIFLVLLSFMFFFLVF